MSQLLNQRRFVMFASGILVVLVLGGLLTRTTSVSASAILPPLGPGPVVTPLGPVHPGGVFWGPGYYYRHAPRTPLDTYAQVAQTEAARFYYQPIPVLSPSSFQRPPKAVDQHVDENGHFISTYQRTHSAKKNKLHRTENE